MVDETGQATIYGAFLPDVSKPPPEINEFMQYIRINPTDNASYVWFMLMVSE